MLDHEPHTLVKTYHNSQANSHAPESRSHAPSPSISVDDSALVQYPQQTGGPVVLTKGSRPAEVKMWLENKNFSRM